VELGDYVAGATAVDEALRYASVQDLDGYVQYLLGIRALIQLERCEWDAALADAEESLNRPSRTGVALIPALVARGRILAARGATDALSTLDRAADHAYPAEELQRIGPVAAARSEYFLLTGDPARAAEEARSGLALAVAKGHRQFIDELAYRLWQATGETADSAGGPHRMLMAGDWAGAAREWARRGRGYTRLDALAAGDRPAAAEALRVLNEIGADRAAHRLRARLRRRGLAGMPRGPRPATLANAAGLTPRQLEVLRLLAEGLSNAAIAARLTLSPKTVEHHISAVLEKLDVTTRGQAIAAAHRLNLVG